MDIGRAVLRPVKITRATVSLRLVAPDVNHSHVVWATRATQRLGDDVIQVDPVLKKLSASDLLLTDRTPITLLDPQAHTKR